MESIKVSEEHPVSILHVGRYPHSDLRVLGGCDVHDVLYVQGDAIYTCS